MRATLGDYWRTGAGVNVSPANLASPEFQARHPWSAAFISWVMRQAGAGSAFRYAASHSVYISAAKQNRLSNNGNPFQAYRISEAAPALGDLVCKSRDGSGATYDNIRPGMKTHCDIVVGVASGRITVVGGNVQNSVSKRTVAVSPSGLITTPGFFAVIKVGNSPAGRSSPGGATAPAPAARPAPAASRVDASQIGRTIYAPIDLAIRDGSGRPVRPQTGIFCPARWRPSAAIDVIVYLHGIRQPSTTVDSYWNAARNPHFGLREDLAASGKNALLVVPLVGPRSQNQIGILGQAGGFDRFLTQVIDALQQNRLVPFRPQVGNIILACHSGGGLAIRTMALAANTVATRVRECWGFDCTYNSDDYVVWPRWAARYPNSQLRLFYLRGTHTQALRIANLRRPNIAVIASNARNHNLVPRQHFLDLLRTSTVLQSI